MSWGVLGYPGVSLGNKTDPAATYLLLELLVIKTPEYLHKNVSENMLNFELGRGRYWAPDQA